MVIALVQSSMVDEREIEDRGGGNHSVPREIEGEADGGEERLGSRRGQRWRGRTR